MGMDVDPCNEAAELMGTSSHTDATVLEATEGDLSVVCLCLPVCLHVRQPSHPRATASPSPRVCTALLLGAGHQPPRRLRVHRASRRPRDRTLPGRKAHNRSPSSGRFPFLLHVWKLVLIGFSRLGIISWGSRASEEVRSPVTPFATARGTWRTGPEHHAVVGVRGRWVKPGTANLASLFLSEAFVSDAF